MAIYREQRPSFSRKPERAIRRVEQDSRYSGMNDKEVLRDDLVYERTKGMMSDFYQGIDPRRREEIANGGMVQEDHRAMANLSPNFIHKEFPRFSFWSTPFNDAIMQGDEDQE
jgi:hypothetical protein